MEQTLSSITYDRLYPYPSNCYFFDTFQVKLIGFPANIFLQQYRTRQAVFEYHYPEFTSKIGGIHQHIGDRWKSSFTLHIGHVNFAPDGLY